MQTFIIDDDEERKIIEWRTEHDKKCQFADPDNQGAIGGRFTTSFTNTTVGKIIKVACWCGEEFDPTDYNNW